MLKEMEGLKITDYLAIYAAILSSSVFIWNILQSKPRLKIDLLFSVNTVNGVTKSGVTIVVRNTSSHDIHLGSIGLAYPYRRVGIKERLLDFWHFKRWPRRDSWCHTHLSNYSIENSCPMCLDARKSHHIFIPQEIIEELLSTAIQYKFIATVQDQLWNNICSKPFQWPRTNKT